MDVPSCGRLDRQWDPLSEHGGPHQHTSSGTSPSFFNQDPIWFESVKGCSAYRSSMVQRQLLCSAGRRSQSKPVRSGRRSNYLDNVRTKGARNLDLSLYKNFKIRKSITARLDVSSNNVTNTPQFGYPTVPNVVSAVQQGLPFGLITNTVNTPRQYQFGARVTF